jgi:hypothetical protein
MRNIILSLTIIAFLSCDEIESGECPDTASCIAPDTLTIDDLPILRKTILNLAIDSYCESDNQCDFVGFGSKPCGGPWEYLIYSNNADTTTLFELVDRYNELDKESNILNGKSSDCAIAIPPDSVICSANGCVAYRGETAFTEGVCCN